MYDLQMQLQSSRIVAFLVLAGTRLTFWGDVDCTGDEPNLHNCTHNERYYCSHNRDVGVVCPQGVAAFCVYVDVTSI